MSARTEGRKGLGPWKGRIFLSVGRALYLGPAGDTTPHAHHAVQVCVALDTPLRLRDENGPWREYGGVAVAADAIHQLDGGWGDLVLFYIEPETREGRHRLTKLDQRIRSLSAETVLAVRTAAARIASRPPNRKVVAAVFEELMRSAELEPNGLDPTDPRVEKAVEMLRANPAARITMHDLAQAVGLSPSRFRHLFRNEIGMSAQSYIVWLRIYAACAALAQGESLSHAAYQSGFSDAAHFTRTFRRTFGLAPSQVTGRLTMI